MQYTEVDIRLEQIDPFIDIVVAKFNEIEFEAFAEDEYGVKAYVKTHLLDKDAVKEILYEISDLTELSFTINNINKENWNAEWERNFSPVFINKNCVIRANFHVDVPNLEYEIVITPKMSFGTGHHETTFLVMNEMFDLDFKGKSVLDIGSGTGILSILASKLGAKNIVGIDLEEWAFKNSNENVRFNNVDNINFVHGDVTSIGNQRYDIVLANINRNTIITDMQKYVDKMNPSAKILLSGFLFDDIALILKKAKNFGLQLVISKNKNKWQMLHLERV